MAGSPCQSRPRLLQLVDLLLNWRLDCRYNPLIGDDGLCTNGAEVAKTLTESLNAHGFILPATKEYDLYVALPLPVFWDGVLTQTGFFRRLRATQQHATQQRQQLLFSQGGLPRHANLGALMPGPTAYSQATQQFVSRSRALFARA